jgi:hypothetical protein
VLDPAVRGQPSTLGKALPSDMDSAALLLCSIPPAIDASAPLTTYQAVWTFY